MSLYLILFSLLLVFAIFEYRKGRPQEHLYWIALFCLGAMLCFRYAQGTDYYGYYVNYLLTPKIRDIAEVITINIHGELGWKLLCSACRELGMTFELLVFLISLFELYCIHRFVSRWCPLRTVALLLFYPTLYLTYTVSALRQGSVLLFFLGFMIDWLYRGKGFRYLVGTMLCATIHTSAVVFLVLYAIRFIRLSGVWALVLITLSAAAGICASQLLPKISSAFATYANFSLSIPAVGERFVSLALIVYVFWDTLRDTQSRSMLNFALQVYLYGMIIYAFLMWNALISARFHVYFKAVELMLFTTALLCRGTLPYVNIRKRDAVAMYLLALNIVMYIKNIGSYIHQGGYFEKTTVFNYPYLNIFNKDAVEVWRTIPYDFSLYLE